MTPLSLTDLDRSIIPVTRFNKGESSKIFKELQKDGVNAVFKNNKREAIIMSPAYYDSLMELLADQILLEEAGRRLAAEPKFVSFEESMKRHGITAKMLEEGDDEDIEIE